ncbi:hypothetical protein Ahy_A07g035297 [Arachis hypogaea]|uniref:Uncharacterized protein n=1 Tax=Arachis hypogaea TaxID=3818 RepID=A0A445CDN6_ARAHY|nr:hypothetical protein Ahy_A07g035297 [Arachis hypogaea]
MGEEDVRNVFNDHVLDIPALNLISTMQELIPQTGNICNNACEVFNSKIKKDRAKPIITLLEEVLMFAMRSIAKNKVKLSHHIGKLPPI